MPFYSRSTKGVRTIGAAAILCVGLANCSPVPSVTRGAESSPDLEVVASVSDSPPPVGALFTLSATVRNAGEGPASSTTLRYYRSTDTTITRSDTMVGRDSIAGLPASGSVGASAELTAPGSPGTYFFGACVDAESDESDTTNNCSTAVQVTVHTTLHVPEGHPDLAVVSPAVSDDGPAAAAPFTLSATITNEGDGPASSTMLRYYKSTVATITRSDTQVAAEPIAGLAESGSLSTSVELTAPMARGTYYFGACVDAVAEESDTTNNCSTAVQVTVHTTLHVPEGHPDLAVVSPAVSDDGPAAAAPFTLSATITNEGDGPASSTMLRYYRSTDTTTTTSDTQVAAEPIAGLAESGSLSTSVELTAPVARGTYYFGACVDAVAEESDTTDNCSSSVRVDVLRAVPQIANVPDLVVGSASVNQDSCAPGTSITLSTSVRNRGDGQSPATTLRYFWSTDATVTTSDTEAGTDAVEALAAAGTSSESVELTAPSRSGAYSYGACVDPVAGESDTTNNCSASRPFHVLESRDDGDGTRAGAVDFGDITGNSSPFGYTRVGAIGGPGDRVDYYRFTLSEEKRVEVGLRTVHRTETRTDLFLEDDAGGVLFQHTDTVGAIALQETLQAGTYHVRLQDDSGCLSIYVFGYKMLSNLVDEG